jgi:hypothetical protein
MDVRIGTTLDGRAAGFDTSNSWPLMLVGDAGCGKTTTARYLTRWWLANTRRHAHLYTQAPSEWSDLQCNIEHPDQLAQTLGQACGPDACLVVVDDIDLLCNDQLALVTLRQGRTILTSNGAYSLTGRTPLGSNIYFLGLVRPDQASPAEAAVLDGQGRLDWPADTVAVIPDQRGPLDIPRHRWQPPAAGWAAVAR